jgi:hypothetical protein
MITLQFTRQMRNLREKNSSGGLSASGTGSGARESIVGRELQLVVEIMKSRLPMPRSQFTVDGGLIFWRDKLN